MAIEKNMELFKTAYEHSYDYIFEYPLSIILILALMFIGLGICFISKKKMISILTVLVLSIVTMLPVKVMAAEYPHKNSEVKHVNLLSDKTEYGIQPQTDGYYYWKVDSKTNQGTTYGSWRLGPQGAGPGTVSVNKTDTVTNTISGSYTSVGDISASLGATIGKSQSYSVQYP